MCDGTRTTENTEQVMQETYDDRFEQHELLSSTENEWTIGMPGRSEYWTRIIARPPFLIVVGDIDTAVFQGHHSDHPVGLVDWAGTSSIGYIATKCSMGMSDSEVAYEDCYEEAASYVAEMLEDEDREPDIAAAWDDVECMINCQDPLETIKQFIADEIPDGWEIAGTFGRRVSTRVRLARAACRRLKRLLDGA